MSLRASSKYMPLRVTAHLRTGVVCDEYLPLDGILYYQAMREQYGARAYSLPGGGVSEELLHPISVPLAQRHGHENRSADSWWYACSFACTPTGEPRWWLADGEDYWNKRFDQSYASLIDFSGRRGRVIVEQGHYRAYHMPLYYRVARQVSWFCVGEQTRIKDLLSTVTHVGKKATQGWGRVMRWIVEPWPEDWSCWREDKPMRALPVAEGERMKGTAFHVRYYGLHPSYFERHNQMAVIVP